MRRFTLFTFMVIMTAINASAQYYCSCLPEGITFTTQEQIDSFQINYPGCTVIEGDVLITGNNIINLNGLNILTSIGGDLKIGDEWWSQGTVLQTLSGLNNLVSIGGDLFLFNNTALTSLAGLNNLQSIGGSLSIGCIFSWGVDRCSGNPALVDLYGLVGLNSIGGDLTVVGNNALVSLEGLEALTSIGGKLSIGYESGYLCGNDS